MDRFAISLSLGYPSFEEELQMLEKQLNPTLVEELEPCVSLQDVKDLQKEVFSVRVAPEIQKYIVNLINASRQDDDIALGVSPRGTIALQKASQALAFLEGRDYVIPDDIKFLAPSVLSHRLIPAGGRNAKVIVARLLNTVAIAE